MMSVTGEFYQYLNGELVKFDHALSDPLSVADSWLVSNGMVRAFERHAKRFSGSISDPISQQQMPEFLNQVKELTPLNGDWFPRIEYRETQLPGQRLFLRMREAPLRTATCSLYTHQDQDTREQPFIKGPDLSLCQKFRRLANLRGADEAVLVSKEGYIADGALSAILWWEGDVLVGPDDSTNWLPSITRELVFELARQGGYKTATRAAKPNELEDLEVWSLSALQGIRGVTGWGDIDLGQHRFLAPFRKRLELLSASIKN
jgi:branched-subunit amino acid aminotransferase/4-amino-4-deoxychorismate lyase